MSKPEGYPFLKIAKRYGLDYSDVLLYAEAHRAPIRLTPHHYAAITAVSAVEPNYAACNAIANAISDYRAIQRGEIDWQTGLQPDSHFNPVNRHA